MPSASPLAIQKPALTEMLRKLMRRFPATRSGVAAADDRELRQAQSRRDRFRDTNSSRRWIANFREQHRIPFIDPGHGMVIRSQTSQRSQSSKLGRVGIVMSRTESFLSPPREGH